MWLEVAESRPLDFSVLQGPPWQWKSANIIFNSVMKNLNTNKNCDDGVEITYVVRVHVLPHAIVSCSVLQIKDYSKSL
jgi:hypothetical protein